MTSSFADLGVTSELVERLHRNGITEPFDIQRATIPDALAGRDVLGRAPTGSGKTLAFGIPMLMGLESAKPRRPRGLILSPTRELAEQIRRELAPLAQVCHRHILTVYGGVGFRDQLNGLRNGADLLVACPGRLIDLLEQGELQLADVDRVVVDEADRMADMGFLPQVREILDLTAPKRQTVLFSATLDDDVQVLIDHYQDDPVTHQVGEVEPDLTLVTHRFFQTAAQQKLAIAADLIDEIGPTIVFCRTRHGVDRVARQLKQAGIRAGWIHGGRSQSQRDAALYAFTSGKVQALVATDVAARGIHVDGVQCVIHFDPPADQKDYVHRSGRTARAGEQGVVVSFVNRDQERAAKKMLRDVGLPDVELEPSPPISNRADHVKIELRSTRSGTVESDKRSERSSSKKAPLSRGADRPVDDPEWRSSSSGRRGGQAGTGPARRVRSAARTDRTAGNAAQTIGHDADTEEGGHQRRAPSAPRSPKPTTRSRTAKPARGKKGRNGPVTSKRSGKPRPKNKKAGRKKGR